MRRPSSAAGAGDSTGRRTRALNATAIPLANATAPQPPSRFATRSSNTATVGFMMREYVFPYSCRLKYAAADSGSSNT